MCNPATVELETDPVTNFVGGYGSCGTWAHFYVFFGLYCTVSAANQCMFYF